jgi:hypothetical protein
MLLGGDPVPDPKPEPEPEPTPEPDKKDDPEPEPDKKEEEPDKKDEPEPEDDDDDEPLGLTAEELEAVNSDEKLVRVYKSMQRGLTKKSQSYAEKAKELEESAKIAQWIDEHPEKAYEAIGKHLGKSTEPAKDPIEKKEEKQAVDTTVDEIMERAKKHLGEGEQAEKAAKILGPLVQEISELVAKNIVTQQIAPIKEDVDSQNAKARENVVRTEIEKFGAAVQSRGDDWSEEIVTEMADQMDITPPNPNGDPQEYFGALYDRVMMVRSRSSSKREQLRRLKEAKKTSEPSNALRPQKEEPTEITGDTPDNDAFAIAVRQAEAELR